MLATAWWHQFLTFPPCVAWAQFSLKHAKGLIKAGTFIPSLCLTRGSCRSSTQQHPEPWVDSDPDGKTQGREEP